MNPQQQPYYPQANPGGAYNPYSNMGSMMQWAGGGREFMLSGQILWFVTWILAIVLLVSLIRLIWKMGDRVK